MFEWFFKKRRALREVEDLERFRLFAEAAEHGRQAARIRLACSTVNVSVPSDPSKPHFAADAASGLVRRIADDVGYDLRDENTLIAIGVLLFTTCSHFSRLTGADFGIVTFFSMSIFTDDPKKAVLLCETMGEAYNELLNEKKQVDQDIGEALSIWCEQPSLQNFQKLVELFKIYKGGIY